MLTFYLLKYQILAIMLLGAKTVDIQQLLVMVRSVRTNFGRTRMQGKNERGTTVDNPPLNRDSRD